MSNWPESDAADAEFELLISTYGNCDNPNDPEFNPLEEKDMEGNVAMFQDPSRGRLAGFTTNEDGAANNDIGNWPMQFDFMQNLSGENSILGRSIYLVEVTRDEDSGEIVDKNAIQCCPIVVDKAPMGYTDPVKPAPQPYYPHHSRHQDAFW